MACTATLLLTGSVPEPGIGPDGATHAVPQVLFVAPAGNDAWPGSRAQPFATIGRGLRALAPGDTLFVRGGTYPERDLVIDFAGTAALPITIRNEPGETPIIDGALTNFRHPANKEWELHDAAKAIYRSVRPFPGLGQVYGCLGPADGGFRLVPYETAGPLACDNEDYAKDQPYYAGPGVYRGDDQHLYVRLVHSKYQQRLGHLAPTTTDPRRHELALFGAGTIVTFRPTAAHLTIEGLTLLHAGYGMDFADGCHHITIRQCRLTAGRYEVVARGRANHLTFDRTTFDGRFPPWVARSDVKLPEGRAPAHLLQGAGMILEDDVHAVEVTGCTFTGLFDAIDAPDRPVDFHIHHNRFTTIRDDAFEIGTAGHGIDFHDNVITIAAAGVSWTGSGAPPRGRVGTKYIHHNVIDTATPQLYGRDDPRGLLPKTWRGPAGLGMATGRCFGSHDMSRLTGPDPWKIYHNTIIGAADVDGGGLGLAYRYDHVDPSTPHEVYNNVLVQTGDQSIVHGARVADRSQVFDGNLYFRSHAGADAAIFTHCGDGRQSRDFERLRDFAQSSMQAMTHRYYSPGWEKAGREGDPDLDVNYRPSRRGPAATGAVDLSATGWPGTTRLNHRGALAPR